MGALALSQSQSNYRERTVLSHSARASASSPALELSIPTCLVLISGIGPHPYFLFFFFSFFLWCLLVGDEVKQQWQGWSIPRHGMELCDTTRMAGALQVPDPGQSYIWGVALADVL